MNPALGCNISLEAVICICWLSVLRMQQKREEIRMRAKLKAVDRLKQLSRTLIACKRSMTLSYPFIQISHLSGMEKEHRGIHNIFCFVSKCNFITGCHPFSIIQCKICKCHPSRCQNTFQGVQLDVLVARSLEPAHSPYNWTNLLPARRLNNMRGAFKLWQGICETMTL